MKPESNTRVLLVDRNEAERKFKLRLLEQADYTVNEAADAATALALIAWHASEIDIVILDVGLPNQAVLDLCRKIKALHPAILLLLASAGQAGSKDRGLALDAGADAFLAEPAEETEFIAQIRALLRICKAERRHRKSEEHLRLATDAAGMFSWECDLQKQTIRWSDNAAKLIGCAPEDLSDKMAASRFFVAPDDSTRLEREFAAIIGRGDTFYTLEFRGWDKDPIRKLWRAQGKIIYDATGAPSRIVGITQDITCRKLAERRLQEIEQNSRTILESISDGFFAIDRSWRFTFMNRTAEKILDRKRDELIGQVIWEVYPGLLGSPFEPVYRRAMEEGTPGRLVAYYPDHQRFYEASVYPYADGVSLYFRDVTERTRAEETLRAGHDTFRHLVENSPFGVYAIDADFRLVQVSQGAQKVFENVRPLLGRDFAEVLRIIWPEPFASEAISCFRHTLETGTAYHAPSTVERRSDSGDVESYDWKIERITLPDGRFGVVCHFYDLSERQRYEDVLRLRTAKLEALINSAPLGLAFFDRQHRYLRINNELAEINGISAADHIGRSISELLPGNAKAIVPLLDRVFETGEPVRSFEVTGDTPREPGVKRHWLTGFYPVFDAKGQVEAVGAWVIDITPRKQAEDHVRYLMREVNHRSKNLLSVVQAVAQQISRHGDPRSFVSRFGARLGGLAASHDLLVHNGWQGVDLAELVRSQLAHFRDLIDKRVSCEGPPLRITPGAAQTIGMALHELATNAGKYGSLSNNEGHVAISWKVDGQQMLRMRWVESEGPPVAPPKYKGFGHTVMVRMAERSLEAKVNLTYEQSGLVWEIIAPAEQVLEQSS